MTLFLRKKGYAASVLIWLITILLVAATISSFIFASVSSLQQTGTSVARKGVRDLSSALFTIKIWAIDGRNATLTEFCWKLKHFAPGQPVPLEDVLLEIDTNNDSADLILGTGPMQFDPTFNENGTAGYWTNGSTERGYFSYVYLINGSSHRDGVISPGDIVKICFMPSRGLTADEDVLIQLILKEGWSLVTPVTIPYYSKRIVDIFPISDGTP